MKQWKTMGAAVLAAMTAAIVGADESGYQIPARHFEVTITNLTPGISFTPLLVATHSPRVAMFRPGQAASDALALLAEGGDTAPLRTQLEQSGESLDSVATSGLLAPGASVKVRVRANGRFDRLSIAGMLLPTNDGFVALNSLDLPWDRAPYTVTLIGYDAGSEPNDERCANIPGPHCGGAGASPGVGGEGFVHVHNGIHGFADLSASTYDWRNPIAQVTIRRVP
jgi:hypothetical protein